MVLHEIDRQPAIDFCGGDYGFPMSLALPDALERGGLPHHPVAPLGQLGRIGLERLAVERRLVPRGQVEPQQQKDEQGRQRADNQPNQSQPAGHDH